MKLHVNVNHWGIPSVFALTIPRLDNILVQDSSNLLVEFFLFIVNPSKNCLFKLFFFWFAYRFSPWFSDVRWWRADRLILVGEDQAVSVNPSLRFYVILCFVYSNMWHVSRPSWHSVTSGVCRSFHLGQSHTSNAEKNKNCSCKIFTISFCKSHVMYCAWNVCAFFDPWLAYLPGLILIRAQAGTNERISKVI